MSSRDTWLSSQYLNTATKDMDVALESSGNPSIMSIFPAHKLVLKSQSTVFTSLINTAQADPGQPLRLKIKGSYDPRTVEYFLRFLYTKNLPKMVHFQNMCELLQLADSFDITDLYVECEKRLRGSLSVDTVCQLYEIASRLYLRDLHEVCRGFIFSNSQTILNNDLHFALLGEQNLKLALCKTPKSLARDHEWNKKTKDGESQRKALLRWKKWMSCVNDHNHSETLGSALEMQNVEQCVSLYAGASDPNNWIPDLYMDANLSDVELVVEGGAKFPAHSLVLNKQSETFLSMWNEIKSKTDLNNVVIVKVEVKDLNARTTEHMLRYLYTHDIPAEISDVTLMNLLSASRRFEISPLEEKCVQLMLKKINLTNCCQALELAERLDITLLWDFCFKKILENADKIFRSQLHFALSKQTFSKVLASMKNTEEVKDWSKWRCCLLGVDPDGLALDEMTRSLTEERRTSKIKADEEKPQRNSVPKMLLFSRNASREKETTPEISDSSKENEVS